MYEERVQYALDNFIEENYFMEMGSEYHLREGRDSGKSDLLVHIDNVNLCIYDFDNKKKCNFLKDTKETGMKKSVDHLIFEKRTEGWFLHMIEMKKTVGGKTWRDIKLKMRASYLTALAIAQFLGIEFQNVFTYTTYEKEAFEKLAQTTNPKAYVPPLGVSASDLKKDEWDKNRICMTIGKKIAFSHHGIKMTMNQETSVLEGSIDL